MSDLKIQGVVEMSSEGAERAFDRIGQKADSMAAKVTQTSGQAGQAVDQIGAGADRSANEFTRAEGRIVSSIRRATTEINNLGKTASQRIELRIDTSGLDKAKFEPLLANLRELESAQNRVTASGRGYSGQLQNTSYQLQDFIVQVNGGTDATRALAMQLPQMLIGFGAAGAAIGVVAALLPNLISLFSDSADSAKSLDDAMSGLSDAVGDVGQTVKTFDMTGLYEQFNAANAATRAATIEQIKFQQAFLDTQRIVSQKAFGESLKGVGEFGFLDKLTGGGTAGSRIADDLGVTLEVAEQLAPVLKGLRDGTEDVGSAFTRFGTQLLSGNKQAVALATAMRDLATGEKDAYAASSALSEALERMSKGYVQIDKAGAGAGRSSRSAADAAERLAEASRDLVQSLLGQSSGLSADFFKKWNLLGAAYKAGAISLQNLTDAQAALLAQQPAMKQAAKDAEDYGKALASTVGALESRALALETELANYGLTKTQIERTTIARMEEVRAMAAANGATEDYLANLDREIAARRRIAQATAGIEAEEANRRAAEQAAQDWQRTADAIEDALIDALMEGGKSGKEYIEGLFRTMVLRPIVQAIVQPIAGGITSAMGFGAPGQGGSAGGSMGSINPLSIVGGNSIGNAYGSVFGSLGSSSALAGTSAGNWLTGVSGNAGSYSNIAYAGAGIAGGFAGDLLFDGKGYSSTGGSLGAQLGMAVAGPVGAAAGAVLGAALGSFIGGGKPSDKSSWATYDPVTGRTFDVGSMTGKKDPGQEQRDATAALAMLTGGFAGLAGIDATVSAMIGGRDGTRLKINRDEGTQGFLTPQAGIANGGQYLNYGFGDEAIRKMLDDLVDEGTLPQATIDRWRSLQANVDGSTREAAELVDTLALINQGLTDTEILRADLIQAEGEALSSAANRIAQLTAAFEPITADDAWAKATQQIADQFAELGQAMPSTSREFGRLMDSLDLTTDAGQDAYRSLTNLAPAFLTLASVVDEVFASISKTTADSVRDIEMAVLDNAGKYAYLDGEINSLIEKLGQSVDPATIQGLFEQINAKTTQAFNLLDEAEQKRLATQFIDRLYEAESLAQSRLSVTPIDYQPQQDAAVAQQQAAQQQAQAAADLAKAASDLAIAVVQMGSSTQAGAGSLVSAAGALSSAAGALSSSASRSMAEVGY